MAQNTLNALIIKRANNRSLSLWKGDFMELEEIKQYLRIDHDEDDAMLATFKGMADEYIKNAVGQIDENRQIYKLANVILVGHWYDNRELVRIGNASYPIPHSFESIIQQLRYCKDDES